MTRHPDVAVVGAGIVGSCVAYELARRGHRVTVFDPTPGQRSSWGNAGMVSPSYCQPVASLSALANSIRALLGSSPVTTLGWPLPPRTIAWLVRLALSTRHGLDLARAERLHRMAVESLQRYDELARTEGIDFALRRDGWLWLYRTGDGLAHALAIADRLRSVGVGFDVLDAAQVRQIQPGLDTGLRHGIHYPDDAVVDPGATSEALLTAAERSGVRFVREQVTQITARGHRVVEVETATTAVAPAELILCTGAQTAAVLTLLGARAPIVAGYGWSVTIPAPEPVTRLPLMLADDHVVVSPQPGHVRLTSGMRFGGRPGSPPPARRLAQLRAAADRAVPALRQLGPGRPWRGARPMTVDGEPIIDRVHGYHNVTLAAGHGVLGVTLAPATALRVADIIDPPENG